MKDADDDVADGGAAEGSAASSEDETGPATAATESSGTSEPSLSHDEVQALCAIATTRAECEAVPMGGGGTDLSWCAWETWTAATIDARGVCTFGPIEESCGYQNGGDACVGYSSSNCGANDGFAGAWDGTRVGLSPSWCYAPGESCSVHDGVVGDDGAPECACLCDPSWPEGA